MLESAALVIIVNTEHGGQIHNEQQGEDSQQMQNVPIRERAELVKEDPSLRKQRHRIFLNNDSASIY